MKRWILALIVSLTFSGNSFSQTKMEDILRISWDTNSDYVKGLFPNKSFADRDVLNFHGFTFNDDVDSYHFEVGFLFSSDNKLIGKVLSQKKDNPEYFDRIYKYLREILFAKFGNNTSVGTFAGMEVSSWKLSTGEKVLLTNNGKSILLTILKN